MSTYTAPTGSTVTLEPSGIIRVRTQLGTEYTLPTGSFDFLRNQVCDDRDITLNRWRTPAHPDHVVYTRDDHTIDVLNETDGTTERWTRTGTAAIEPDTHVPHLVAVDYFTTHPDPKPWAAAAPGETWALTVNGTKSLWARRDTGWERIADTHFLNDPGQAISAGTKITIDA